MGEVIDITQRLKKQRYIEYLTKGIDTDLSDEMKEEFKYMLEGYLNNFGFQISYDMTGEAMLVHDPKDQLQLTIEFDSKGHLDFITSQDSDFLVMGKIAIEVIKFWEEFETQLPVLHQNWD